MRKGEFSIEAKANQKPEIKAVAFVHVPVKIIEALFFNSSPGCEKGVSLQNDEFILTQHNLSCRLKRN
ncbi:MAG: hypothetical protein DI539_22640 [Flavobacterium psychrophilum]|nr:MAG: hypothetical protein DI539_22640 [Flavobacterium psychrophilum]